MIETTGNHNQPRNAFVCQSERAYIGIGSNLGTREANVQSALALLGGIPGCCILRVAALLRTAPVNCPPGSGEFLNTVAELETALDPETLMRHMLEIERRLGRVRSGAKNEPRTIDLDLLLYGNRVLTTKLLVLPHPQMALRDFVLRPLAELVPELVHPALGCSVKDLLAHVLSREVYTRSS